MLVVEGVHASTGAEAQGSVRGDRGGRLLVRRFHPLDDFVEVVGGQDDAAGSHEAAERIRQRPVLRLGVVPARDAQRAGAAFHDIRVLDHFQRIIFSLGHDHLRLAPARQGGKGVARATRARGKTRTPPAPEATRPHHGDR